MAHLVCDYICGRVYDFSWDLLNPVNHYLHHGYRYDWEWNFEPISCRDVQSNQSCFQCSSLIADHSPRRHCTNHLIQWFQSLHEDLKKDHNPAEVVGSLSLWLEMSWLVSILKSLQMAQSLKGISFISSCLKLKCGQNTASLSRIGVRFLLRTDFLYKGFCIRLFYALLSSPDGLQ